MTAAHAPPNPLSRSARWRHALKPASFPKLLVPAIVGQAIGIAAVGHAAPLAVALGALFTVADLVFIVLMNDVADIEVDALKRRMFPDAGSPKTIPDGILPPQTLATVGATAGFVAVMASWTGAAILGRPGVALLGTVSVLTFLAYSFPPLRLNYRGGGEVLEAIGTGLLLPGLNAALHGPFPSLDALWPLGGLTCLALAGALASGLADEESDRQGGKRTVTTWLGNGRTRALIVFACLLAGGLWALTGLGRGPVTTILVPVAAAIAAGTGAVVALRHRHATTNAFSAHRALKRDLHLGTWTAALVVAYGVWADAP